MRLWVDTDRWHGVPFLLRTGKMLDHSSQRLSLVFRSPADGPLTDTPEDGTVLTFDLAGDGAIDLAVTVAGWPETGGLGSKVLRVQSSQFGQVGGARQGTLVAEGGAGGHFPQSVTGVEQLLQARVPGVRLPFRPAVIQ